MANYGAISYSFAAAAYFVLAVLLVTSWRGRLQGGILVLVCAVNILWALFHAYVFISGNEAVFTNYVVELLRYASWFIFLVGLSGGIASRVLPRGLVVSYIIIWTAFLLIGIYTVWFDLSADIQHIGYYKDLFLSLGGLVLIEQLYRNTSHDKRNAVKFLYLGLGALFAFDLYIFSSGLLLDTIDMDLWISRGAVTVLIVPLIAIAASRNPEWSVKVFVSRHVAFYSTSLIGVGIYLLAMSFGGYYLKSQGEGWGSVVQIIYFFAAIILLIAILLSDQLRTRLILFINKHFYHNKYDYREEWMRIINTLSDYDPRSNLYEKVIQAIAQIIGSKGGMLWLKNPIGNFNQSATMNMPDISEIEAHESSLIKFLDSRDWIINIHELEDAKSKYGHLELPKWLLRQTKAWLVIPLRHDEEMIGFIVLSEPNVPRNINWEDRDLLKAVSRQAASYIVLRQASEELERSNQFDAFNRLSAYIVHDLKNIVAQLNLIVTNSKKHKHNPLFMDDAIKTIDNAVKKMSKLLSELRKGKMSNVESDLFDLDEALKVIVSQRSIYEPIPTISIEENQYRILCDQKKLITVIGHIVQNAQEATSHNGKVQIALSRINNQARIIISDTGCGMTEDFIKDRLFRPFDTTKGNAGMGIGVYECKEFVEQSGGRVRVNSRISQGTEFNIYLPLA